MFRRMNALFLCLSVCVSLCSAYNILCVFPVPSHSHNQLGKGIVDVLLQGGHKVTWVTPYPEKVGDPPDTLTLIDVSSVKKFARGSSDNKDAGLSFVKEFARKVYTKVLSTPAVKDALVLTQFDAIFSEKFFTDLDAGMAAVQQVPWLVHSSIPLSASLKVPLEEFAVPMGFTDRAVTVFYYLSKVWTEWLEGPQNARLYESLYTPLAKARGVPLPPLSSTLHNVSMFFINSHELLSPAFNSPPNIINIAGYHIDQNPPPLPDDLQQLLNGSPQGVVYFSMGSILQSSSLKSNTREELLQVFSKLPHTVLWKFEEEISGDVPKNVHVRKWFPQLSVLAHPNTRAFITHGGQLSILEALSAGVPLLVIPVFGDQPQNAMKAERDGYGVRATFGPNMAEEIGIQLKELLENKTYTNRAKSLSKLLHSRLVHPTDLIKYYTELAIETKGAYHLRSLSLQYSWYELWMLDVAAAALALLTVTLGTLLLALRWCIRKCSGKSKASTTDKKKKNK